MEATEDFKKKLVREIELLLQGDNLPFVNVVVLMQDKLIDVFSVPGGRPSGTLQLRIEEDFKITANLSWTWTSEAWA